MDYMKIYNSLIQKRLDNPITKAQIYCESHHILPRCLGGSDDKSNLVNLTANEADMQSYLKLGYILGRYFSHKTYKN